MELELIKNIKHECKQDIIIICKPTIILDTVYLPNYIRAPIIAHRY